MILLWLSYFLFASITLWVLVTQLFIPIINGRPSFPMFRKRWSVQTEIDKAKDDVTLAKQEADLERLKTKAQRYREQHIPPKL